jgi:hypothetical protein
MGNQARFRVSLDELFLSEKFDENLRLGVLFVQPFLRALCLTDSSINAG